MAVLAILMGMYGYFTPKSVNYPENGEIPLIELSDFSLYEISHQGIEYVLEGREGKMFDTHYAVKSAKFSDNTKSLLQSVQADTINYKKNKIVMDGNVYYVREDGLEFHTDKAEYNTKASLIHINGTFTIRQNRNHVNGEKMVLNTENNTISADRVSGQYDLN
ncbi:MAG: hypothetical protein PHW64_06655 [Sulfuricurvum sp.]|nr:hypothetical protein [Sulfuricurvum sp.]